MGGLGGGSIQLMSIDPLSADSLSVLTDFSHCQARPVPSVSTPKGTVFYHRVYVWLGKP